MPRVRMSRRNVGTRSLAAVIGLAVLSPQGLPYSGRLRLVERYGLLDGGERMQAELVIDDPEYYEEPWTVVKRYRRLAGEIMDYECIVRPHVAPE